jgi:hypothetical protein
MLRKGIKEGYQGGKDIEKRRISRKDIKEGRTSRKNIK